MNYNRLFNRNMVTLNLTPLLKKQDVAEKPGIKLPIK